MSQIEQFLFQKFCIWPIAGETEGKNKNFKHQKDSFCPVFWKSDPLLDITAQPSQERQKILWNFFRSKFATD